MVNVVKYKITIEEIKEPLTTIQDRLEKLCVECDNWHNWEALTSCAKKYKYQFKGNFGSQRKGK